MLRSGVKLGARVLMLITPAVVFLPNNVPCGPRKTSSCSMSIKSNTAIPGRPRYTLSMYSPTLPSRPSLAGLLPRPRIDTLDWRACM